MPSFTVNANEISQPLFVPAGTLVTVTPGVGATVVVEYTLDSGPTVFSGLATWVAWPNGSVTASSSDILNEPGYIRVRPTGGSASVSYDTSPGWQQKSQFLLDWGAYNPARVAITGGTVGGINPKPTIQPYKFATFGDSRNNTGSTSPDVGSYQLITNIRTPGWFAAFMGDAEIARNYGVSGDTAAGWASASRTGGKTFADLNSSGVDAVLTQFGVNDAMAGTAAATIAANLQALGAEVMKGGKFWVFESINPVLPPATNAAATQVIIDAVNAAMQTWLSFFPKMGLYIDTASSLKDPATGLANAAYYNADGIHFIQPGAYLAGKILASAVRSLLPKRIGAFVGPDNLTPNLLNLIAPSTFSAVETGTASAVTFTNGQDANGFYTDATWTPATLTSGECRVRLELSANFQTATVPYYALLGNEVLQASARVICDDGAGGKPNTYAVSMRQRFYTAAIFRDWGIIPPGSPGASAPDLSEKLDVQIVTPRVTNTAASTVANPASASGYQMQVFVSSSVVGIPVRVRLYNPQLRRVGYANPVAVTPGASPYTYTNNTAGNQYIYVAGGTVSAITHNGVSIGQTSGAFLLSPGDTLTVTYSVAPTTFTVKQF